MIKLDKNELRIIKQYKALPLTVILKRIDEIKESFLNIKEEEFKGKQEFLLELKRWIKTINIGEKEKKEKRDNFV